MTYTPTEHENIETIRKMNAAENVADWDTVYDLVAPDCVTYMGSTVLRGKEEHRDYDARFFLPSFSSYARTILDIAADGDSVVFRWRADAVLAADGRDAQWEAVSRCRVRDGRVAEGHIYLDSAEVQRQMSTRRQEEP